LAKTWKVVPVVNQIQLHVGMGPDPEGLVSYCRAKNIQIQAYSPLDVDQTNGTAELITGPLTNGIGLAHGNKSGATVALKWLAQQRVPLVTKAHSLKYLREDIDLYGWELTKPEMAELVCRQ
jgi:diketogulonate reductase-like aldo/keto reductase